MHSRNQQTVIDILVNHLPNERHFDPFHAVSERMSWTTEETNAFVKQLVSDRLVLPKENTHLNGDGKTKRSLWWEAGLPVAA